MRTIQIKQQKSPSRVISSNGKSQSKQLNGFTDNRQRPIQRTEDLTVAEAALLEEFRVRCEERLWTDREKNQEVQVGLTGIGQLIIGYNYGCGQNLHSPNRDKTVIAVLKTELDEIFARRVPGVFATIRRITEIKIAKPKSPANSDSTVHAEISILLFALDNILQEIAGMGTSTVDLYMRGKKYTCGNCKSLISSFDTEALQQCLRVHTPTKKDHLATSQEGKDTGTRGAVPKWHSPLDELSSSLTSAEAKASSPEIQEFLTALKPHVNPEKKIVPAITERSTITSDQSQPRKRTTVSTHDTKTKTKGKDPREKFKKVAERIPEKEESDMKQFIKKWWWLFFVFLVTVITLGAILKTDTKK